MIIYQILTKGVATNKLTLREFNSYFDYCLALDGLRKNSEHYILLITNQYDNEDRW